MFMMNRDQFETQEQFEAYLMWKAEQKAMGVTFTEYRNEDTVTSHYEYEEGLQEEAASSHSLGMPIEYVTHMTNVYSEKPLRNNGMAKQILVSGDAEEALDKLVDRMRKAHKHSDTNERLNYLLYVDKQVRAMIAESLLLWAVKQEMEFKIMGDHMLVSLPNLTAQFTIANNK